MPIIGTKPQKFLFKFFLETKRYLGNSTTKAFILSNLVACPFFGIFALLPMILCKELNTSSFQNSTLVALKPLTALLASYWSCSFSLGKHRLSLLWAYFLKFLPFVFASFFSNPWIFILAFGIHMLLLRGTIPSWMELLKQNLSSASRGKICALSSTINYLCTALLPFLFCWILDEVKGSWRGIFVLTSLLGMSSIGFILKIASPSQSNPKKNDTKTLRSHLSKPWKSAKHLLRRHPDFLHFQIGFFLGGAGLMVIQAVIPKYFTDYLKLSYTKMFLAVCFCKGIGFTIASPLWVKLFNRCEIFTFCARIPLLAAIFPILLIFAHFHGFFIFLAYLLYGIMQAGSELSWKMSGPIFSRENESTPYSSINVLAVGVRGGIFPYLGALLFIYGGPYLVFTVGGFLCLTGGYHLFRSRKKYALPVYEEPLKA